MAAPYIKTNTPGIYKRGKRYYSTLTVNGKLKKKSHRTMKDARAYRDKMRALIDSGQYVEESKRKFADYALEWIEKYQGNGRSGFRENTRDDYRRDIAWYAVPYLGDQLGLRVTAIRPRHIREWILWLCDEGEQGRRRFEEKCRRAKEEGKPRPREKAKPYPLADATVRRIVAPVRACLSTAREEDLILQNPVDRIKLPHRPRSEEEEEQEKVKAFTVEQLEVVMAILTRTKHRLFFLLIRGTGLRWSEMAALQWGDLHLDGSSPHVKVRRGLVRGKVGPLKSKYSRRSVPLSSGLVDELRAERKRIAPDAARLVFVNETGGPLNYGNMLRRVLKPAVEEADASWAGFHAFRHTWVSMLIHQNVNILKISRWVGHHSAAFTTKVYGHLIEDAAKASPDEVLEFDDMGAGVVRPVGSEATRSHRNDENGDQASGPPPEPLPSDSAGPHRNH
jgi:integrase